MIHGPSDVVSGLRCNGALMSTQDQSTVLMQRTMSILRVIQAEQVSSEKRRRMANAISFGVFIRLHDKLTR